MSWQWTAEHLFRQLGHTEIELCLGDGDELIFDAPEDFDVTLDFIQVIKKFKPGLIRILKDAQKSSNH